LTLSADRRTIVISSRGGRVHIRRHLSHTDEIEYRLPISCVRIAATITEVDDSILEQQDRTAQATVDLIVVGGEQLTARIDSNVLQDTSVGFSMTDEGVLVSSSVDSSGEAGKVLLGVVSVGASVAGAFVGAPAAFGALATAAHLKAVGEGVQLDRIVHLLPEEPEQEKDPVMAAFAKAHPAVYRVRKRYAELVEQLQARAADALDEVRDAVDATGRRDALWRLRTCERALDFARAESSRLDEVFNAWRATSLHGAKLMRSCSHLTRCGAPARTSGAMGGPSSRRVMTSHRRRRRRKPRRSGPTRASWSRSMSLPVKSTT
jgi:hypothetical protein